MANITAGMVKELREATGCGMMDCKKALQENDGDFEKAKDYLREKGLAAAAKRSGRITAEGLIESYIHGNGRIGVLLEINCETDFVAKTSEFKQFARDIAMQVAASSPEYVSRDEVPQDVIDREKKVLSAQAKNEGKPDKIIEKMVQGRIDKYFREICLLEQPFIKDTDITVQQLLTEKIAKTGENISIRRFVRFELGEGLEKRQCDFADEVMAAVKKDG